MQRQSIDSDLIGMERECVVSCIYDSTGRSKTMSADIEWEFLNWDYLIVVQRGMQGK